VEAIMDQRRFVYGPVPSRRLGRSLGVDLVPYKTCCYDCVYCQLGPTRRLSTIREPFVPVAVLVDQVRQALARGPAPDAITLAGSGEPTLFAPLGELITALKAISSVPVVLLTNGSLFGDTSLRHEAALADIVIPSLDAGDEAQFRAVNRPHVSLTLEHVVAGLEALRGEFTGSLWLEVMLVAGQTDDDETVGRIAGLARRVRPDWIHLNTPVRPSRLGVSAIVPQDRLEDLAARFSPPAEVVAEFEGGEPARSDDEVGLRNRLLELLARRPCTLEDASRGLAAAPNAVLKALAVLRADGQVREEVHGDAHFWAASHTSPASS
jgi:wyosine [tRNA(Phe)-imidazoG37] synthetase (radical SAM superfamily)